MGVNTNRSRHVDIDRNCPFGVNVLSPFLKHGLKLQNFPMNDFT